jgi:DNA-binding NtrC family response regulator
VRSPADGGLDPVAFTDPVEALRVFKAAPRAFGLVVTDRRMPQMSGDELVRSMLDIRPGTRIVMCSGALQTPLPPGLSGTLAKPALLEDVINLVGPPPAREATEALT